MKRPLPAAELARDERFVRSTLEDRIDDPRTGVARTEPGAEATRSAQRPGRTRMKGRFDPSRPGAPDQARALMHGIFVGEIQALEGAGRTCFDFDTGDGADEVPFQLKLDMARQCWDEARHCEISAKLSEWMGTEIGEFAEDIFLFEAACNPDPVLRLTGVNRALEGLAIDVFNTMRDFGLAVGDPVLFFCEDWMLSDEVTHVKMGSDWLRRLTADDPQRRDRALEFQRVVDRLFSSGGFRGEDDDSPVQLARRFREMAGFTSEEIDSVAEEARRASAELEARLRARSTLGPAPDG
ncbi:MAG TPA: DUF455 family protein [Acidimicrobiales bacterium]|nr:DUF455 family protein [Acidimicrobiales bacterium]